ncbi:MAG: phosphoribosylanthranilate isomerase [Pseudomonadota bacterium]
MSSPIRVKICGLTAADDVAAAVDAGAGYVGFVLFPKSPRNVSVARARDLALAVSPGVAKVGLLVDPDDAFLDEVLAAVPFDILQLHGRETPQRVAEVRSRIGLPVMKAVGVAETEDLDALARYEEVADMLLVDAKPPRDADRPGGHGLPFDWRILANRQWARPWMLAGGLTPDNVATAISLTGARQVDVSSGVEHAPGKKDAAKIAAFCAAARAASGQPA